MRCNRYPLLFVIGVNQFHANPRPGVSQCYNYLSVIHRGQINFMSKYIYIFYLKLLHSRGRVCRIFIYNIIGVLDSGLNLHAIVLMVDT